VVVDPAVLGMWWKMSRSLVAKILQGINMEENTINIFIIPLLLVFFFKKAFLYK